MADSKPLHNAEAEETTLGSLLINPEAFEEVFDILQASDFHVKRNQWVFEGMLELFVNGASIDFVTLCDELERRGKLADIGGPARLTELVSKVPNSGNLFDYADVVLAYSQRRKLEQKALETVQLARNLTLPIEKIIVKVDSVWQDRPDAGKTTLVYAKEAGDELKARLSDGSPQAAGTSLPNENIVFGGYPLEGLTLLMGDSSIGKTSKMFQDCESLSERGERVLFFTFEHTPARLLARRVFSSCGISIVDYRRGTLNDGQRAALKNASDGWMKDHPTFIMDNRARTLTQMRRSVRQARPKLVVVDDLTHVQVEGRDNRSETSALLDTATRLHDLANDFGPAVVAIHHITAEEAMKLWPGGKKPSRNIPPSLNSLTWAKDLRYRLDMWLALVPDVNANVMSDRLKIIEWVLKDREGQRLTNPVELYYHKDRQLFFDNTNPTGQAVGQMPSVKPSAPAQTMVQGQM